MDVDTRYDAEQTTRDAHAHQTSALTVVLARRGARVTAVDRSEGGIAGPSGAAA